MVGLHVFAVAAVVVMVLLGRWQLSVYDGQQAQDRQSRASQPPVALASVMGADDAFPSDGSGRRVTASGRYGAATDQFYVRGQQQDGRTGYWVVTPLVLDVGPVNGKPTAVMVVRGWTSTTRPVPAAPTGTVTVTGSLEPPQTDPTPISGSHVLASVRVSALVGRVPYDLYGAYLIATSSGPGGDGLETVSPPQASASWTAGLRNLAYALQWWVFAAFAVFIWWRICFERIAAARTSTCEDRG